MPPRFLVGVYQGFLLFTVLFWYQYLIVCFLRKLVAVGIWKAGRASDLWLMVYTEKKTCLIVKISDLDMRVKMGHVTRLVEWTQFSTLVPIDWSMIIQICMRFIWNISKSVFVIRVPMWLLLLIFWNSLILIWTFIVHFCSASRVRWGSRLRLTQRETINQICAYFTSGVTQRSSICMLRGESSTRMRWLMCSFCEWSDVQIK